MFEVLRIVTHGPLIMFIVGHIDKCHGKRIVVVRNAKTKGMTCSKWCPPASTVFVGFVNFCRKCMKGWLIILLMVVKMYCSDSSKLLLKYSGEYFPEKYLKTDISLPSRTDLQLFLTTLKKTIAILTKNPNNTDCNVVVGTYVMTCVLRRTLLDSGSKMDKFESSKVKDIIRKGDYYVSHYVYSNRLYGYSDLEYRVSLLYKDANIFTNSIYHFNENRLSKWILGDFEMHPFVKSIDNATLGKDKYIHIIESMHKYYVNITESDICLSRIMETPEPLHMNQLQPCRPDDYCKTCLLSKPSIGYSLSHRLLNMVFRRFVRRCYLQSDNEDNDTIDILCAFMYRETVYLARRGYFARDMFLEHVALCALLGYKEFHRLHWFKKAASWVDEKGCMQENRNFDINRTEIYKTATNCSRTKKKYSKYLKGLFLRDCHTHPMTLLTVVLAHAIRYVAHFI